MAWWAHGSAESPIIWALGVCTGQYACLVLLRPPAVQEGGQIEIGVLLVLPFPLSAEILSLLGCLRLLLGLRGTHACSTSGGCVVIVVGSHSLGFSNTVV